MNELLYVLFLVAGRYKSIFQFIPVDLTVAFAVIVVISCFYKILRKPAIKKLNVLGIMLFFTLVAVMLFSLLYTSSSIYAYDKIIRFIVLNGIAYVCVFILFNDSNSISKLLDVFVYASLIMAIAGIIIFALNRYAGIRGFVSVFGSNYLALGRTCGMGAIICLCKLHEKIKLITIIQLVLILAGLSVSGGKAPVIAFVIVFVIYMFSLVKIKISTILYNSKVKKLIFISAVLVALFIFASSIGMLDTFFSRLKTLQVLNQSASYTARMSRYAVALESWTDRPILGNGIGSFGIIYDGEDIREYPHNIIIEILVELGLVGLLAFVVLIAYPIKKCMVYYRKRLVGLQWHQIATALIFIYVFINSCISGDINDNRLLFTFMALMWMV